MLVRSNMVVMGDLKGCVDQDDFRSERWCQHVDGGGPGCRVVLREMSSGMTFAPREILEGYGVAL